MKLRTLVLILAALVGLCVYAAGNYIDFARQSNAQVMRQIERGE